MIPTTNMNNLQNPTEVHDVVPKSNEHWDRLAIEASRNTGIVTEHTKLAIARQDSIKQQLANLIAK